MSAADDAAELDQLNTRQAAEYCDVSYKTWTSYKSRGQGPEPDGYFDPETKRMPYWFSATLDAWTASRPGHGGRPRKTQK